MSGITITGMQDGAIVADASAAQSTPKARSAAASTTSTTPTSTTPSEVGGVQLQVSPNFGNMKKLGTAQQQGTDLLGAICLAVILAVLVIGIAAAVAGKVAGFPDWESRGKKAIIFAPLAAFLLSMTGQVVGWGWTLGVS